MKKIEKEMASNEKTDYSKEKYEPPKATVIEIRPEEKLLGCNQPTGSCTFGWQN